MDSYKDETYIRLKLENTIEDININNSANNVLDLEKKKYQLIERDNFNFIEQTGIYSEEKTKSKTDLIFGEKFNEQADRIRKNSPFGNCNSWKLFKIIVKSGEDLRQEQFASQLINEFYQIFKMEKVDVWLNPYEILSTGCNVGIIECVPDAVSLDYLKRKTTSSLRQFYLSYFDGPKSSSIYIVISRIQKGNTKFHKKLSWLFLGVLFSSD